MIIKTLQRVATRKPVQLIVAIVVALVVGGHDSWRTAHAQTNTTIKLENQKPGNPQSEWDIAGAGDPSIQGFATDISVNAGLTVGFKIQTDSTNYRIDIYRLGYYGGLGARKITTLGPFSQPQNQGVTCATESTTGLFDCGNWAPSASWSTAGQVSGIYIAKLVRLDTGGSSHIVFVVRDDTRQADVVVQTSDTTWQAYNRYGTGSLYCGGPISNAGSSYANSCSSRSAKVSYNRPIDTRGHDAQSWLFAAEYPMVRWLEANGYDVKYQSGVDTDRRASDLIGARKPKVFVSSGHDEYWSAGQRASVEAARGAGVNLAFFSGNEMYWKTRYEASIDGAATQYRTLVSYKDTLAGVKLDPMPSVSTSTWRDTRFGPPVADSGRPENGVMGNIWTVNSGTAAISVPASMASLRFWRNTRVPTSGGTTLAPASLGYEWDEDLDNGARPAGIIHLSSTTVNGVEKIVDFGATTGTGTATHTLTLYRHSSGARVFGAGTVQWSWGLDGIHDDHGQSPVSHTTDLAMQQATVNLLADMGVQPELTSLQSGLIASVGSTDVAAPTSIITSPVTGGTVGSGTRLTIVGTAADSGGGVVAGVEVSVDGGTTWSAAQGGANWSYGWVPGPLGQVSIRSRAIDDSGNIETPGAGVSVTVDAGTCPCPSIWPNTTVPSVASVDDPSPVELGLKFRSDISGNISGVRFYRGPNNTGTHIGNLWTSTGTQLATATFVETDAVPGWQQVLFGAPVAIAANTTYVVSYHTNAGNYAADPAYFTSLGVDAPPLHALPSNTSGGNGAYVYGGSAFPTTTFNATNYWVDVVFAPAVVDTTPPAVSAVLATPIDNAVATIAWSTDEASTTTIDYSTNASFPASQTSTVSDPAFVTSHKVRLTGLAAFTQYFYRLRSTDRAGNSVTAYPGAPSFSMPGPTLRDMTSANFGAGSPAGSYVSETDDGEVILAPATGTEFSGSTLPSGWSANIWSLGGTAVVGGGRITVDGARVATCAVDVNGVCQDLFNVGPGHSLEFVATFTGDPFQHSGFGQALAAGGEPIALFSTTWTDANGAEHSGSSLGVRTGTLNASETRTNLGSAFLNSPHRYRIDWQPAQVLYYVDGVQVATHAVAIGGLMRPVAASDFNAFSGNVVVDWVRQSPFAATGSFVSRVFDAGSSVQWQWVQWTSATPPGSSVAITVCTSDTLASGALASPTCAAVAASGPFSATSRYVQYRATLSTSDANATPELSDVMISVTPPSGLGTGSSGPAIARDDSYSMPQVAGAALQVLAPGVLGNDSGAKPLRAAVTSGPLHGTLTLNMSGSFTYSPASGFGGTDSFTYSATNNINASSATVTIIVGAANQPPVPSNGALTTNEDTPASGTLSATDADGNALIYSIVTNGSIGSAAITNPATGAFTYTPIANANGSDTFTFKVNDGTVDSTSATMAVTVNPVNDAPSFTRGADQAVLVNAGPQTVAGWATAMSAGPANEASQTLSFVIVSNTNASLFSAQPAIAPNGTLTYTPSLNVAGTATVAAAIKDNGLTANGGVDTSATQTFTINVARGGTTTTLASSNNPSLFGVPITLTATITPAAATGAVAFKDGANTLTCGTGSSLMAPIATCKTSSLAVGSHPITAIYAGSSSYIGSTSATMSQVIGPSAMLSVQFITHEIQDNTNRPRVREVAVANALVRVYKKRDLCPDGLIVSGRPKIWGQVFDGLDGYHATGDVDAGCPVVQVGNYRAEGTTDAAGRVNIIVPPALAHPDTDYIVIGRTLDFDDVQTAAPMDPLYAEKTLDVIRAGTQKNVLLHQLRLFNGKRVPGRDIEEFGTYLAIVEPEYMDWTSPEEQYPFVLIADGDWGLTTSIAPPEGFVADVPELATAVSDAVTALQFTLKDVGSDWSKTGITHVITHKGETRIRTSGIPMFNHQPNAGGDSQKDGQTDKADTPRKPAALLPSRLIAGLIGLLL